MKKRKNSFYEFFESKKFNTIVLILAFMYINALCLYGIINDVDAIYPVIAPAAFADIIALYTLFSKNK